MSLKISKNYSINFNAKKRSKKNIKFVIFHYTGMKTEKAAIKRLTDIQSQVAAHYLIRKNGEIINMVPDLYIAWHAGISSWNKENSLNKSSIGIEITNPGHQFGYENFSKKQINSLIKLSKILIKKYKINKKNFLGHSDIAPDRKKDPGEKFPWKYLAKRKIGIWHKLDSKKLKKFRNKKCNKLLQRNFINNIFEIGYSKKSKKNNYLRYVTKAFQRRYRPELINGKIDQESLFISQNLI